jgi:hypothetical protein
MPKSEARPAKAFDVLIDRNWSPRLPINCWLIEHPERLILVDIGESSHANDPGYQPWWHLFMQYCERRWVRPEEEVAAYDETALLDGSVVGVAQSASLHRASTRRLHGLCKRQPTITQVAHDPERRPTPAASRTHQADGASMMCMSGTPYTAVKTGPKFVMAENEGSAWVNAEAEPERRSAVVYARRTFRQT